MFPLSVSVQTASAPLGTGFAATPDSGSRMRVVDAGAVLYWEDDPSDQVFEVVGGILRLYKLTAGGRRQLTGFVYPGHFLGMARDDAYIHTAEAVTPCQVRSYTPGQLLRRAESDPSITRHFLSMAISDLLAAQERMLLLGRKTAIERLASFLVELSRRNAQSEQDATEIHLPMTRGDIADYLGVTIETVSRMFTRLKVTGIIRLREAHLIQILDPTRLLEMADDEHSCGLHWADAA